MMDHFAFDAGNKNAKPLCGARSWFSICNSLSAVSCEKCRNDFQAIQDREAARKEFAVKKLEGLFQSFYCGFIGIDDYAREVATVVALSNTVEA